MSEKKTKKDKDIVSDLETQIKDVRRQLDEQLVCLDQRLSCHHWMTWELMEFYQHRSEIELEYSKSLDRLVQQTKLRQKSQKRETSYPYSTYKLYQTLLDVTLKKSKSHFVLHEVYRTFVTVEFNQIMDDMQRIYSKCRKIAVALHGEVLKVLVELQNSMSTYHSYHSQSRQSESKLERAETQRVRVEEDNKNKKGGIMSSKRFINYEKQTEKHKAKLVDNNQKVLKARNEYILCVESANACIRKFFIDDLPELMNAMDYGYHVALGQTMVQNVKLEEKYLNVEFDLVRRVDDDAKELNQRSDRQSFIQITHQIFSLPKKFEFQAHKGDSVSDLSALKPVRTDLTERLKVSLERIHSLKLQNDELWKTLETTDNMLMEKQTVKSYDMESVFQDDCQFHHLKPSTTMTIEMDKQKMATQEFYLTKLQEFLIHNNTIARLQAKSAAIEKAMINSNITVTRPRTVTQTRPIRKKQLGKATLESRPKLFGGCIEEYVQATGQEIPIVVKSCINIINLHGMHHQGLFRIPGSQQEINEFKNIFERGEEVILSKVDTRDINSVTGVLKLYFRELREPLFPLQLFDELIACTKYNQNDHDEFEKFISRIQELILPLPRPIVIVMRYLFAFLNHVTEYSDENMMDGHNLAICIGPTLLPLPHGPLEPEQMQCQSLVNDLVQSMIVNHDKIFPDDGGLVYEKCMAEDDITDSSGDVEYLVDSVLDNVQGEDVDDEVPSSSSSSSLRLAAVAVLDFEARSIRELSFKKGDSLVLITRLSTDWWEGYHDNQKGLVPHRFIAINQTNESPNVGGERIRTSSESLPAKHYESTPHHLPPVALAIDRSLSESNICDDVTETVKTTKSCSSTNSDISHGGYSSASWSNKSSSSKDVLDDHVTVTTDSGSQSPFEFPAHPMLSEERSTEEKEEEESLEEEQKDDESVTISERSEKTEMVGGGEISEKNLSSDDAAAAAAADADAAAVVSSSSAIDDLFNSTTLSIQKIRPRNEREDEKEKLNVFETKKSSFGCHDDDDTLIKNVEKTKEESEIFDDFDAMFMKTIEDIETTIADLTSSSSAAAETAASIRKAPAPPSSLALKENLSSSSSFQDPASEISRSILVDRDIEATSSDRLDPFDVHLTPLSSLSLPSSLSPGFPSPPPPSLLCHSDEIIISPISPSSLLLPPPSTSSSVVHSPQENVRISVVVPTCSASHPKMRVGGRDEGWKGGKQVEDNTSILVPSPSSSTSTHKVLPPVARKPIKLSPEVPRKENVLEDVRKKSKPPPPVMKKPTKKSQTGNDS